MKTPSLHHRLFVGIALSIAAASLAGGLLAYRFTFNEALEMQDGLLDQIAAIANRERSPSETNADAGAPTEGSVIINDINSQAMNEADRRTLRLLPDGFHTIKRNDEGWRILLHTRTDGTRFIVGQPTEGRDEIARSSALHAVVPLAALIPFLIIIVAFIIRQSFLPMERLARGLPERRGDALEPLPLDGLPQELGPFVAAINSLLERVRKMVDAQRSFIAHAAHELRSPITAIVLQAENLASIELDSDARERLTALKAGALRTRNLLEHLLIFARFDVDTPGAPPTADLAQCAKDVVADILPQASAEGLDLGFVVANSVAVRGESVVLQTLIRNLIENAIRYTPSGGRINIGVYRDAENGVFYVEDTGPGVLPSEMANVFEPFFRGSQAREGGAGLGLAIVKRIVDRLGGSIVLENLADEGGAGLRATARLPVAPSVLPQ